tara:strand:+ start:565 stop:1098 length:534 start_codon:yes stop_codon:yes gene_type:complete
MTERVSYLRCSAPKCDNPLSGQRTKFCSSKCSIKVSSLRRSEECKKVYASLDWAGGPRGMVSESSVKKDECFVGGTDRWCNDDYHVDPEIFAIAEANHDKYLIDRAEHENRVVIDGLNIFKESYNENHNTSYETQLYRKRRENEDYVELNRATQRIYYAKHKEKIDAKARKVRSERS